MSKDREERGRTHAPILPPIAVFAIAVGFSVFVHSGAFQTLRWIKALQPEPVALEGLGASEVEFEISEDAFPISEETEAQAEDWPSEDGEGEAEGEAEPVEEAPVPPARRRVYRPPPEPEPEPAQEEASEQIEVQPPPPQDPPDTQPIAVEVQSPDPTVEAPENPRFIAEENQRTEEETQAQIRNMQIEQPDPQLGAAATDLSEEGNADEPDSVEDTRDREGAPDRFATAIESQIERPDDRRDPLPPIQSGGNTGRVGNARTEGDNGGERSTGGGEDIRYVEINDGSGTLRVAVRNRPEGSGAGAGGGASMRGPGQGGEGRGRRAGRAGEGLLGELGLGRGSTSMGPDLRASFETLDDVYTREALDAERERWLEERRSRLRGSNRAEDWEQFRAALENFTPNVRPGNQTALNTAASPFATYIAQVHRRLHRQYADVFLRGLPAGGSSPFSDNTLNTKLEIVLNRDGTVHRVGVVKTSGVLPFDYGAFRAVMRGQPYPEPPGRILSGDGRVYFHWGFYRNARQCGTFNAEPYILANPPASPSNPFQDGLQRGGTIPSDARPNWGTAAEGAGAAGAGEGTSGDPADHDHTGHDHDHDAADGSNGENRSDDRSADDDSTATGGAPDEERNPGEDRNADGQSQDDDEERRGEPPDDR
ncbi:MAG: TonB C-terminal domain-containing protein [Myxococcota bacterium]